MVSLLLLYGYLKWKRFVYTLEEDKILIRRGVLFREELSIYTGRIHSMNMERPCRGVYWDLPRSELKHRAKRKAAAYCLPSPIAKANGRGAGRASKPEQGRRNGRFTKLMRVPTQPIRAFPLRARGDCSTVGNPRESRIHSTVESEHGIRKRSLEDSDSGGAAGRHTADDPGTAEEERARRPAILRTPAHCRALLAQPVTGFSLCRRYYIICR